MFLDRLADRATWGWTGGGLGVEKARIAGSHPCQLAHSLKRPWPRELGGTFRMS